MSETKALKELFREIEHHAIMRAHGTLMLAAKAELDALLAENEQLKNHAVPFAVLTNENELLTADNALLRKQLDEAMEKLDFYNKATATAFLERMKK
jgi:regulator of replication initiation timing